MSDPIMAWHWIKDDRTLRDGRPMVVGETVTHDGPIVICESGLHASERVLDALQFAPGNVVCRVVCSGVENWHADKFVCRSRRVLWAVDATDTLRAFARRCALDVAHLWNMPAIVREYLDTGDESQRDAAWDAAMAARAAGDAWDAARAAAWAKYNGWLTDAVEALEGEER